MTDGNEVSGQQAAQPATTSPGVQPQGQTLSPDVIQQVVEQTVEKALSAYEKRQQSQRDKQEARINKRLSDYEGTYKSLLGQDLTPEQRSQLRTKAIEDVTNETREMDTQVPSPVQAAQPAPKAEVANNPVERMVLKAFEKAGVTIEDGDPELELLKNADPGDILEFSAKISTAIEQKKTRLQNKPSNLDPSTASARVSAAVATGSPTNLETQYYAELDKVRGNIEAILQIKTKYRKLGLQVN